MPTATAPRSDEARVWLRDCAAVLRRLLGERWCGDPTTFVGGAGVSAAMITAYLREIVPDEASFLERPLQLLQELDILATTPAPILLPDDYQRLSDMVQQIVLSLTDKGASRVLRTSNSL